MESAAPHPVSGALGAARLKRYWTVGLGAAKIAWATPGDLTRCHMHLAKYVGSENAWGLCQTYHKAATGRWNDEGGLP